MMMTTMTMVTITMMVSIIMGWWIKQLYHLVVASVDRPRCIDEDDISTRGHQLMRTTH